MSRFRSAHSGYGASRSAQTDGAAVEAVGVVRSWSTPERTAHTNTMSATVPTVPESYGAGKRPEPPRVPHE
ncbi:hypothetical protein [Streptomyces sp. NBC_01320]|uniref:hypothetical protein n=1 Tax=Streptomyces sp. NBC_01320 TaxID=2903824 RepID=UPI002E0D19A9|nr:hypothetical protein OG395_09885 [Streptomyces sp. NBC_01320]